MSSTLIKRPAEFFLLAAWMGLLTGLGEVCVLIVKQSLLKQWIHLGREFVWMTPLADLIFFATIGFFLFLVATRWPRVVTPRMVTFILTYLGFFSLSFMFHPQLDKYAGMLLAAGLATQSSRFIVARGNRFLVMVRRSIGWMVVLVMALAVGVSGWQALLERRALAKLPPPARNAPNILLIVLDAVRAQNLSVYGYGRPTTPHLERFAQTGVLFERAISTAPWTLPSHGSIFTGRWPHELSTNWLTPLDDTYPTLAGVLSARGYLTAAFVANTGYVSYEHGVDRGFAHYEDYSISPGQIVLSSSLGRYITESRRLRRIIGYYQILGRKRAAQVNSSFLQWLSGRDERPFFAFLNYYDAHAPYLPPGPYDLMFGPNKPGESNPTVHKNHVAQQEIQAMIDGYDGSIAYIDHHLGLLFDEMAKRNLLKNTIVIITSDHGEEFGEHDVFDHGNTLYLPSVHVPLLISFPSRVPVGKRFNKPVSLRDLPVTVMDLLNLTGQAGFQGGSMARFWEDSHGPVLSSSDTILSEVSYAKNLPTWIPVSKGDMKALIARGWRYIKNGDGGEEFYDFENDPFEKFNLIGSRESRPEIERFRMSLESVIALQDRPKK